MKKPYLFILMCLVLLSIVLLSGCKTVKDSKDINIDTSAVAEEQIRLDKTYYNKRFNFEVSYPSIWEIYEESDTRVPGADRSPDQGVYIYFDKNKDYYICVFGQVSFINVADAGMVASDFTTDDGITGIMYTYTSDNIIDQYIVFNEYHGYYGMHVRINKELNDKYKDVIDRILKSLKINEKNPEK